MRIPVLTLTIIVLASTRVSAQALLIDHKAVGCVLTGKYPRFQARFPPDPSRVARARVYFRAHGGPQWYSVDMAAVGDVFDAFLPKPTKTLKQFDYYLDVIDVEHLESRTPEFSPTVVSGPTACGPGQVMATAVATGAVMVSVPLAAAGAPLVPVGFSAAGVTATSAGAAAATGAAAGAGSGVSGTTIGAIAGGVAAAAGVAVVAGSDKAEPAPTPPPPCAGILTSVRVLETSMQCGQREPATISIQNNSQQSIDFQGLMITQTPLSGLYCDNFRVFTSTIPYSSQAVRPGQSITVDYASAPWCCIGAACTVPGNCTLRQDFNVLTSVGQCPGGSATFLVSYGNNCTTICPPR